MLSRKLSSDQLDNMQYNFNSADNSASFVCTDPRYPAFKYESKSLPSQGHKLAIGVIDKGNGQIHLYDATCVSLDLSGERKNKGTTEHAPSGPLTAAQFRETRQQLVEAYAPAKKRRQVRQAINSHVTEERIHGFSESVENLEERSRELAENLTPEESGVLAQMIEMLPPFSLKENNFLEIFNFSKIFPENLFASESYRPVLNWLENGAVEDEQEFPGSKLTTIRTLAMNYLSEPADIPMNVFARLLLICSSMMLYFIEKNITRTKTSNFQDISSSEELYWKIIEEYGNLRGRQAKEKLICHIVCLISGTVLTSKKDFSFSCMLADFSGIFSPQVFATLLSFCGLKTAGPKLTGSLQAPLKIMEIRNRKKKRRT